MTLKKKKNFFWSGGFLRSVGRGQSSNFFFWCNNVSHYWANGISILGLSWAKTVILSGIPCITKAIINTALSLINAPGALQFFKRGMFIRGKFSMQKGSV